MPTIEESPPKAEATYLSAVDLYRPFTGGFLHMLGLVTEAIDPHVTVPERSLRAAQYHDVLNLRTELRNARTDLRILNSTLDTINIQELTPKEKVINDLEKNMSSIFNKAHDRRRLANEVRDSKLHTIYMGEKYGNISGLVSTLNPDASGEPIVFLPGSGSQPDSYLNAAVELAIQTHRKVIICCPPDAPGGRMTIRFAADAIANLSGKVKLADDASDDELIDFCTNPKKRTEKLPQDSAPTHELHRVFMKQLIKSVITQNQNFYLMGHSYGGLIALDLLQNSEVDFKKKLSGIITVNQAGAWNLNSKNTFRLSVILDEAKRNIRNIPFVTFMLDKMTVELSGKMKDEQGLSEKRKQTAFQSIVSEIQRDGFRDYWRTQVSRWKRYQVRDNVTKAVMFSAPIQNTNWELISPPKSIPLIIIGGPDKATGIEYVLKYLKENRTATPEIIPIYRESYDHSALNTHPEPIIKDIMETIPNLRI